MAGVLTSLPQSRVRWVGRGVMRRICIVFWSFMLGCLLSEAHATTKGLSQIVTPDLQPEGQSSLSFQAQARGIANPYQLQAEIGITSWLEAAVFQGLSPGE
jgi:hypothetical protein